MPYYSPDQLLPDAKGTQAPEYSEDLQERIALVWAEYRDPRLVCELICEGLPPEDGNADWYYTIREHVIAGRDAEAGAMIGRAVRSYVRAIAVKDWR